MRKESMIEEIIIHVRGAERAAMQLTTEHGTEYAKDAWARFEALKVLCEDLGIDWRKEWSERV